MIRILPSFVACALLALGAAAQDSSEPPKNRILALLEKDRDEHAARAANETVSAEERATSKARSERMAHVIRKSMECRPQILLGEIEGAEGAQRIVATHWRGDHEYFYPASTVKLCGAVAALERLNEIRRGIAPAADENTPLGFQPIRRNAPLLASDADNLDGGTITVAHCIRECLLVSDNESFNRLYEFCGQDWLNERMWNAGLGTVHIAHRLSVAMSTQENRRTPVVELRLPLGLIALESRIGTHDHGLTGVPSTFLGDKHVEGSEVVRGPMSFFYMNRVGLSDLQGLLARVVRPDLAPAGKTFDLTDAQRATLKELLAMFPGDSKNPKYDRAKYPDDYCKFLRPGLLRVVPKEKLEVFNHVGLAYGSATDNAYVVDRASGRAFFLTATIYADSDGVVGDDQYEYDSLALPWLADVAEIVARDVLARAK
jgi:hypothetical protein